MPINPPANLLAQPQGSARIFAPQRLIFLLVASGVITLFLSMPWKSPVSSLFVRVATLTLAGMIVFGVLEAWPKRLPRWLARWVLQLVGIVFILPIGVAIIYVISTAPGQPPFWLDKERMGGFALLCGTGLFLAPWITVTTVIRQREALVLHQATAFALERSELERKAVDARLRLLQAQIAPHFLFNTLANVRQLIEVGSREAPAVLDSLIAYLRAAVPRLQESATTLGQELELVRAYLELMHLRMPDRLQFTLQSDEAAADLRCPPMTLLTLVENAVRHGIDPSEEGGRIDVSVTVRAGRCTARVIDTGVGLQHAGGDTGMGLGTGLSSLRERLALAFPGGAALRVAEAGLHGVAAEVEFPAERVLGRATPAPRPHSSPTTSRCSGKHWCANWQKPGRNW